MSISVAVNGAIRIGEWQVVSIEFTGVVLAEEWRIINVNSEVLHNVLGVRCVSDFGCKSVSFEDVDCSVLASSWQGIIFTGVFSGDFTASMPCSTGRWESVVNIFSQVVTDVNVLGRPFKLINVDGGAVAVFRARDFFFEEGDQVESDSINDNIMNKFVE